MAQCYEDYDDKDSTYTALRRAIGWEKELDHFRGNCVPLNKQRLFDAGCGTGNYTVQFAKAGVFDEIFAADINGSMLQQAKKNVNILIDAGGNQGIGTSVTFGTVSQ